MAGTDSTKAKVPFGSFILTEQATNEFPWVTELASRYSASPSEVAGGQNAILTNGETYFPPEAVRDIGVDTLRQMNNKPKEGGHASIDRLIAMSTLQGLKPMYGGGEITPNYSGGGLTGYQNGGKIESKTLKDMVDSYLPKKDDMLPFLEFLTGATAETNEYQPGAVDAAMAIPVLGGIGRLSKKGYATLSRLLRRYGKEGRELDRVFGKGSAKKALEPGSDLTTDAKYYREVGIDSPRKEPISWDKMEEIRKPAGDEYGFGSKFDIFGAEGKYPPGFTKDKFGAIFGKTVDDVTGETFEKFRLSPSGKHLPTDAKFQQGGLTGYENGGVSLKDYAGLVGNMVTGFGGDLPEGMYTPEGGLTREGYAQKFNLEPESVNIDTLSFSNPANYMFEVTGKQKGSGADITGTTRATGSLPIERLLDTVMDKNIEDPFERMRWKMDLSNVKRGVSYQQGGLTGYQDGDMVGPPVPPQMMGDAMNRQLSESIDRRMANPEVYQGSTLGAVRQEASALQDSIYQDTVNKARKSLQLIKLQTLLNNPDMTMQSYTEGEFAVPSDKADMFKWGMSALRDSSNMRALDLMKKLAPAGSGGYTPR